MKKRFLIFSIILVIFIYGCDTQDPAESTTLTVPAPDVDDPFEVEEMVVNEEPEERLTIDDEQHVQEEVNKEELPEDEIEIS